MLVVAVVEMLFLVQQQQQQQNQKVQQMELVGKLPQGHLQVMDIMQNLVVLQVELVIIVEQVVLL